MNTLYTTHTSEELYDLASNGDETALWTLCRKYEPLFRSEARLYKNYMTDLMDTEDFISIGYILIWDITKKRNFKTDKSFGAYLKKAVQLRFSKLFQNYSLKNLICISESEVYDGDIRRTYVVSEKTEKYREQQKVRNRRWYEKNARERDAEREKLGLEPVWRPSMATDEEKAERKRIMAERAAERNRRQCQRYREKHPEEYRAYRRIQQGIKRNKESIRKWMECGDLERAELAKERLARYEAELADYYAKR